MPNLPGKQNTSEISPNSPNMSQPEKVSFSLNSPENAPSSPRSHRKLSFSGARDVFQTRTRRSFSFQQRSSCCTAQSSSRSIVSNSAFAFEDELEDSDLSVGSAEREDVCLPQDIPPSSDGVDVGELDALLNMTSSNEQSGSAELLGPAETIPLQDLTPRASSRHRDSFSSSRHNELKRFISRLPEESWSEEESQFSFFATKLESTVHSPDLSSLVGLDGTAASLFSSENGNWWLDCLNPSNRQMKILARVFGIHPLTAEDIRMRESREKFELFEKYYFVVFNSFESCCEHPHYLTPVNFYIIVYKDGILSFHFTPVEHCRSVRSRARQLGDYRDLSPDWICYALIDQITDSFAPLIHIIEQDVASLEEIVFGSGASSTSMGTTLNYLGQTRDVTMRMIRLLSGKAEVLRCFIKRFTDRRDAMPGTESDTDEIVLFLGDIQDHVVSMQQNLSAYEKLLSRCHYSYMGLLQVKFVDSNNKMTVVLNKITLVGTVLIPMNLVTGFFGMNVEVPGKNVESLQWFFGILGVMAAMITLLLYLAHTYFKRKTS